MCSTIRRWARCQDLGLARLQLVSMTSAIAAVPPGRVAVDTAWGDMRVRRGLADSSMRWGMPIGGEIVVFRARRATSRAVVDRRSPPHSFFYRRQSIRMGTQRVGVSRLDSGTGAYCHSDRPSPHRHMLLQLHHPSPCLCSLFPLSDVAALSC